MTKGRILIVEDKVALEGRPLEELLTDGGYDVVGVVGSAAEGVAVAKAERPDLVLMDIRIPAESGADLDGEGGIKAARQIQNIGDISIIFVTGNIVSEELLKKVHAMSPMSLFLTKPMVKAQWLASVQLALLKKQGKKVVFLSYAHRNVKMKKELVEFLGAVEGIGIEAWDDAKIRYGQHWRVEIAAAMRRADVAILLVSIDFINSRFIREFELPALLTAAVDRGVKVVPVFVGVVPAVTLQQHGLDEFQGVNDPGDPLNTWPRPKRAQRAWVPLCEDLARR